MKRVRGASRTATALPEGLQEGVKCMRQPDVQKEKKQLLSSAKYPGLNWSFQAP